MVLHRELLIGGIFIGGPCDYGTGKDVIVSPWNGSVVGTVAEGAWPEAEAAMSSAIEAFATWKEASRAERQELLLYIAYMVLDRKDELSKLLMLEVGKPIDWAYAEVDRMAITFHEAAKLLDRPARVPIDLGGDPRAASYQGLVERFPIGPILAIVPYNWPFNLAAHKIAPALAAGNTVVMKVSPLAPLCGLTLARLIHEAGCPPGVVNAIHCSTPVAERLTKAPDWAMISFTGSPQVGFAIKEAAEARRVTLELGGDAFVILEPDAQMDDAIPRIAQSAFGFAGQVCISTQHVLAHETIFEDVKRQLVLASESCPTGNPAEKGIVCGPLINAEAADRIQSWISEAVDAGAQVLAGGRREQNLLWPTLLTNVPESCQLGCDEVFGPVLTLSPYTTLEQALERVNRSPFGLQTGLFTSDQQAIDKAFQKLEIGGLIVGDVPSVRFDTMPYGGVKRSGIGREGVAFAYDEMTELRTLIEKKK